MAITFNEIIPFLLTICIYTYLIKDNALFRLAEHLTVGATAGHIVLTGISYISNSGIDPLMKGRVSLIIPLIFGMCVFGVLKKEYSYIARYPTAILAGVGTGIGVSGVIKASLVDQVVSTITLPSSLGTFEIFNYVLGIIIVITTVSYFIFTREHKGVLGYSSIIGRCFILAGLGIGYVAFLQGRNTQLISRLIFIIETLTKWLSGT